MKVIVHWAETWTRQAEYEIDEAEFRDWLGEGNEPTGAKVKEFLLAGRDEPTPDQLMGGRTIYPGEGDDSYEGLEITKVVLK